MSEQSSPSKRKWKRMLAIAGLGLLLLVLFVAVTIQVIQRSIVFPSWIVAAHEPDATPPAPGQVWWREDAGVRVEAWFLPGVGVSEASPGPAVIFAHGNGELIDQWPARMQPYRDRGISVLLVEYRGYGRTGGRPSQQRVTDDFLSFRKRMIALPEVDATKLIYHGRSLGGGVVGSIASHQPPAAIVLESTFTSVRDVAWSYGVPRFMMRDPFDTLSTLKTYPGPVVIYHGEPDEIIPVKHAYALAKASDKINLVIDKQMTHNSGPTSYEDYWRAIDDCLGRAGIDTAIKTPGLGVK